MRIRLSDDRRKRLVAATRGFFAARFDEDLSEFRAEELIDFFLAEVGPLAFNQGVQDARAYVQTRLDDLDGEVYEPEPPYPR
jgi:uncharacterized protein (DUF2164 family)